jgi:type I restriction-modification system DNA methylase subunit
MPKGRRNDTGRNNGANLGFEEKLWQAADKLRGHMDAAEYKHVVLGLIFLKYISDAFEKRRKRLEGWTADPQNEYYVKDPQARYGVLEDRDEYVAENIFWVPREARWSYLQANAKQPAIGKLIDDAMVAIEKENPSLRGVLPKDYARPTLDKQRLGELIDLIGTIGLGDKESRSKDILGRVYEYFLGQFASAEGKKDGEFYTPRCVVRLLVEMIEPYRGRVYDPCCGSSGMFVQSEEFIRQHGGRIARTYHAWRGGNIESPRPLAGEGKGEGVYQDISGFCKSATTEEIAAHGYILTPGRYVGAEEVDDDDEPFDKKMKHLVAKLEEQFAESARLEKAIRENLRGLGYGK